MPNHESLNGILPVPKVRMVTKPKQIFSACCEETTHAGTYSKVPARAWERLPRMTLEDKEKIVGADMPVYAPEYFEKLKSGHPLFVQEAKEVDMWLAIFTDLNVTHVSDVAAGSGAAAMAAAVLQISYEGFAMNAEHLSWLDRILNKAMFAIVADGKDEESMSIQGEVNQYFTAIIEEARDYMRPGAEADDISDIDEDDENDPAPED